jgi:rod shape-determining protein MreC
MRNLFRFIATYRLAFLFILLQILSFIFLFRSNSYHNAVFFHSAQHWIGSLYQWRSSVTQYFELQKENEELAEENARLRRKLHRYRKSPSFDLQGRADSSIEDRYEIIETRVINGTVHRRNNHLTIDRGSKAGVEPDMGVIGPNGIVGVVRHVSEHFATVLPVLNTNFRASVRLKRTKNFGILEWPGEHPKKASMVDVAKHVKVRKGDTVLTRGAASIFPPGIPVGKVQEVRTDPSKNYHRIQLELFTDLSSVHHVYVIGDKLKEEKEELEKKIEENVR